MVKRLSPCNNNNYKRTSRKSNRYKDKKERKQYQKNKEKIEKSVKVKNVPRRSRMVGELKNIKEFNGVCPEYLDRMQKRVRIGGTGTMRRKRRVVYVNKLKLSKKESIKQTPLPHPSNYTKGECVVCFEKCKMNEENTIKCYEVTHSLCKKCKDKMKKDVCPLCNNHSIGITINQPKENRISSFRYNNNSEINYIYNYIYDFRQENTNINVQRAIYDSITFNNIPYHYDIQR